MLLEITRPVQGGLRQERKLEVVSNNLANADTTGFKRDSVSFDQAFKAQVNKDYSQGAMIATGNALDFAISGDGFFKIDTQDGIKYTRNGNFSIDVNNLLVDQNGNPVLGQGGAIAIEGGNVDQDLFVNKNGEILIGGEIIDTLDIVTFENLRELERDGQNLLSFKGETVQEVQVENPVIQHKAIEKSNIRVVDEMVRMIDYNRMYETFSKSIQTFDEIDSKSINEVGKLR
jgi:flagellar basal-body rod protein FlgF